MAPTATRSPIQARAAQRQSIVYTALAKLAKVESNRDDLKPGMHLVYGAVRAKVDGVDVQYRFSGKLNIGHDSTSSSSTAAPLELIVAHCLAQMPKTKRGKLLENLPNLFTANGGALPAVDEELVSAAKQLCDQLRSRKTVTKKGSVHFERLK